MKNGIYIYGIIKTSEPQAFGERGIGNNAASKVLTLGLKDIAAVVSRCPLKAYDSLTKEVVVKDLATHALEWCTSSYRCRRAMRGSQRPCIPRE